MTTESLIALAVLVIVVVIGAIVVARSRTQGAAAVILDVGWQMYSRPTDLEPCGTLFRIDRERRRYIVRTLPLTPTIGAEAQGKITERITAKLGVIAQFLGDVANLGAKASKDEQFTFEMKGAGREFVDDAQIDAALDPILKTLGYRTDNRYFIIRDCRTAMEITYKLTGSQVHELGGEGALTTELSAKGKVLDRKHANEFVLREKFPKAMRIMFLPEEIKPVTRGLAVDAPELGRVSVREPLFWNSTTNEPAG